MVKNGIKFLGIALQFNGSTLEEIGNARDTFAFGTLTLQKGLKQLVLDSASSTLEEDFTIFVKLEEHSEDFIHNEKFTQDLADLTALDVAEFYIGEEYDLEPDYMILFVEQDGLTRAIDLKID
jgi:hypothetical protein